MATSLVSTGVQFPDSTIQTTALPAPGTNGNVLTSNGSAWTSSAPAGGGFSNLAVFTSSGTWTVPSGVTKCKVTVTGGGGGGYTTGGNAGGTAIKIVSLSGGSATITIGAGGVGTTGGTSSFVYSATTVSATGGGGGGYETPSTTIGAGSGGDININGGIAQGYCYPSGGAGGIGGASYWGGGGGGSRYGSTPWVTGQAYGSGGGSYGYNGGVSGDGKAGIIVIEY